MTIASIYAASMGIVFWVLYVMLLWLICAFMAGSIASSKGRSWFFGFIVGLLTGPLGMLWAGLLENADETGKLKAQEHGQWGSFIRCPNCAEGIHKKALQCPYCHINLASFLIAPPRKTTQAAADLAE